MATATKKTAPLKARKKRSHEPSKSEMLGFYRDMLLIRRFEEKAGQLYGMGLVAGFCHLYIGQGSGGCRRPGGARPDDQVITGYRDHGHMLAAGLEARGVMAELTGRSGGLSAARAARCTCQPRKELLWRPRHVGAQAPIGTGLAFSNRYKGTDAVCVTYFGDGASNQGQVYEAFNMASLWKLPVVYIIENNQYAWAPRSRALRPKPSCTSAAVAEIPARKSTAWTCWRCAPPPTKAIEPRPQWRRALHPRNENLPLSRPLDVRPREVSHTGRSAGHARTPRSDRDAEEEAARRQAHRRRRPQGDPRRK